ncbi:MAG: hypothetical protein ACYYK0_05570 [Candidatus Eutrophobiaceae bacterium]
MIQPSSDAEECSHRVSAPRYAVMGHPVAHSKSPLIHQHFARQLGQCLEYEAIDVPEGALAGAIAEFRRQGGCGINITLPHKQSAFALCDELDDQARLCGSVNVICLGKNDRIQGMTTDGIGPLRDLRENLHIPLKLADPCLWAQVPAASSCLP